VITHVEFSDDSRWLATTSQDAVMLWDLRDAGNRDIDKFVPIVIENNRQIFSMIFDPGSSYLLYGDNRLLHIYPISIEELYDKLGRFTGGRELSPQEWDYYVKGELIRPPRN
jgi:WD40 repeat protein